MTILIAIPDLASSNIQHVLIYPDNDYFQACISMPIVKNVIRPFVKILSLKDELGTLISFFKVYQSKLTAATYPY